jgi:CheY-like chemotaxis protein
MTKILLVEDDKTLLRGLETLLAVAGHQVRGVDSGEAALEAMAGDLPELIIADILLPGMSGLQLLEAVNSNPDYEHVSFLCISAQDSVKASLGEVAAPTAVYLLPKPFDAQQLYNAVAAALEK